MPGLEARPKRNYVQIGWVPRQCRLDAAWIYAREASTQNNGEGVSLNLSI